MTPLTEDVEAVAREHLAVAHEGAKKPLVALDIRTGNLGRMGVAWVETSTALAAIRSAILAHNTALLSERDRLVEALTRIERIARGSTLTASFTLIASVAEQALAAITPPGGRSSESAEG